MCLHERDSHHKSKMGRAHNKQWQQRLVRSVDKILTSMSPAFIVGPVISRNNISTSRFFGEPTNQGSGPTDDPESATKSLDGDYIFSVARPQKRQRRSSSVGATQSSVEQILITPQKAKPGCRNNSVAPSLVETGLLYDAQRDSPPIKCPTEAHFQGGAVIDWDSNARKPTKVSVLSISIE